MKTDADLLLPSYCPVETIYGVMKLSKTGTYWEIIPKDQMDVFLARILEIGWHEAIKTSDVHKIRDLYTWTDCPSRSDGSYYLPLTRESKVLDLGSGWGSYTFPLSSRAGLVVAADSCMESLRFISLRAKQDGINNIRTAHIDPLDFGILPFASGKFDSVIMNGVLEWVGSYLKKGDPKKIQQNCLKEVYRVLKPGGTLYIGMENRFGFQYFLGAPDDHLIYYSSEKKVAYTMLLPRYIANLISQKILGVPYRTYTHSLFGHKRMLRKAGFKRTDFYYPEDGYRASTTKIIPLKSKEVSKIMNKKHGNNIFFKLASKLFGEGFFCDSYFIVAHKEEQ